VGRPNVGKSTLLNRLVGQPVSITADKPQTTRNRVMGVRHGKTQGRPWQAVFLDTPGIHQAADLLNRRMVQYAAASLKDADLVVMVVEPFPPGRGEPGPQDTLVWEMVSRATPPAMLVVNKSDAAPPERIESTMAWFRHAAEGARRPWMGVTAVSALTGMGVTALLDAVETRLPEGPPYFEEGQVSDQPENMFIAEMIRQEVFRRTHEEIPYSTAVVVDHKEEAGKMLTIHATLLVERDSQKGILIGKRGKMLGDIGKAARLQLEALLGTKIFLDLRVKVAKNWSADGRRLTELGYPEES